jgi:hypothetical protein
VPNKAIESAPGGRPTHKVQCTLFAAHRRRWTEAAEMKMNSELHHSGQSDHPHRGAGSAASVIALSGRIIARHFACRSMPPAAESAPVTFGQAASLGAQLCSSSRQSARASVSSSRVTSRRIEVESLRASSRQSVPVQSGPLSNKRLVPTTQRYAPLGPRAVGAVAAQPKR